DRSSIAELAAIIGAPRPERTVALERQAVAQASRDAPHVGQAVHLGGRARVGRCAIAEFAIGVDAPGPDSPVASQGQTEAITPSDGHDVLQATDRHWRTAARSGSPVSKLTIHVRTPDPN